MSSLGLLDMLIFRYNFNDFSRYLSIATSLIGLAGAILYYKKISVFRYLILFWILIQLIAFYEYLINAEGVTYWNVIFKSKQFFELCFSQTFDIKDSGYKIQLNFIPIIYLIFYQTLRLSRFRDKSFRVLKLRDNNDYKLSDFDGKIIDQFTLETENKSFLIKLDLPITDSNNMTFDYCVIREQKSKKFGLDRELNLNLYLISNDNITQDLKIKISDLLFIDWVEGKIANN